MRRLLICALAGFLATGAAGAGIGGGNGELGLDIGQLEFDSDVLGEPGVYVTLRGGYHVTDLFQIEGQFAEANERAEVFGLTADTTLELIMVNGVFNFHPHERIVPYVLVGAGWASLDQEFFGSTTDDDSAAYQIAGGSRFFLGRGGRTALPVEASLVREDTFGNGSTHTGVIVGLTWRLGD